MICVESMGTAQDRTGVGVKMDINLQPHVKVKHLKKLSTIVIIDHKNLVIFKSA